MKFIYFIALAVFLFSCGKNTDIQNNEGIVYFCGAENRVELDGNLFVFRTDNADFKVAEIQTNEFAFEGSHSIKMDDVHQYGMTTILTDVKKGEYFEASVWQKDNGSEGSLLCSVTGSAKFILNSKYNEVLEHKNGWDKHFLQFRAISDLDSVAFFVFSPKGNAYFDNLKIKRFKERPKFDLPANEFMSINLPDSSKLTLDYYINHAIKEEIIADKYKKYVKASLVDNGDIIPVEIRLKGDWTDHLLSGNPSYRIKTKSGTAYKGLRSFSIQHPKTRNNMDEWFMHKLCDYNGLLSTNYSFSAVKINNETEAVYAIEEHFDKQLLESRNRREGPILKLDESGFWALAIHAREHGLEQIAAPYYESAIVSCFKESRTFKSKVLREQFFNGSILLDHFKNGLKHPELYFDIEQLGIYYALMDLGNVHHAFAWHNRRFYYNPVTAKLEHIGYDMLPMGRPYNEILALEEFSKDMSKLSPDQLLSHSIFLNEEFRVAYTVALEKFASEVYLDSVFSLLDTEIIQFENLLDKEIKQYEFNRSAYYEKAKIIQNNLKILDKEWDKFMVLNSNDLPLVNNQSNKYDMEDMPYYLKEISVNAYRSKIDSTSYLIKFDNYHFDSIAIVGYSVKPNKDSIIYFNEQVKLAGFVGGGKVDSDSILLVEKPSRYFFSLANIPNVLKRKKFIKRKKIESEHPRITLHNKFKNETAFYKIKGQTVLFNQGAYQLDELVYIPAEYNVVFNEGTKIDFVNGGGLVLNGRSEFLGKKDALIEFTSSDSTGMGITILQADSVIVRHVTIENMNTLDYLGWTLTGAFTIYESGVDIAGLVIRNNNCEDALNIIRSNFKISNCLIEFTKSDGFDADFCTGIFSNSVFKNTGNDCIDFSGSTVEINDIDIFNSGDKGVSAGERSTLYLNNITIKNALTGLASKDDSFIEAKNVTVENAEVGLAVFQKKAEYAGSSIEIYQSHFSRLKQYALIEKGSTVIVEGKVYKGYQFFNIEQMYARFDKK